MPWDSKSFAKHNKKLSPSQRSKAAKVANNVLQQSGDEGKAIRIANAIARRKKRGKNGR